MTDAKRDRFGRYILTDPTTGEERTWTRATTFADTLEDTYSLTKWKQRATAVGIGLRPDLLALAQSLKLEEDKKDLDDVCEQALVIAKANTKGNLGTALHKMTERLDRGEQFQPPYAYAPDMEAYTRLKADTHMQTRPDYVERITVVPQFGVAGTLDRIVRYGGTIHIADVKTGNLDHAWKKIAVQLALYSRGQGLWNTQTGTWEPMPLVDQDLGLVIHIPAGEGSAALYSVDLHAGWEAAQLCAAAREWRKRKDLAVKLTQ